LLARISTTKRIQVNFPLEIRNKLHELNYETEYGAKLVDMIAINHAYPDLNLFKMAI